MREMNESLHIITQVISKITKVNNNYLKKKNNFSNDFFKYLDYVSSYVIKPIKKNNLLS